MTMQKAKKQRKSLNSLQSKQSQFSVAVKLITATETENL
jgi:hypothetical protein